MRRKQTACTEQAHEGKHTSAQVHKNINLQSHKYNFMHNPRQIQHVYSFISKYRHKHNNKYRLGAVLVKGEQTTRQMYTKVQLQTQTHTQVQAQHKVEATQTHTYTHRMAIISKSTTMSTALVMGKQTEHLFNENRCKIILCSH